jgi:hypothetical protein
MTSTAELLNQAEPFSELFKEISGNQAIGFRAAYYDRVKGKYLNSCHRVEIKIKAIKRIRPIFINGKRLYKVTLKGEKAGFDPVSRFHEETSPHDNNILSFWPRTPDNLLEEPGGVVTLHDKKDSRGNYSSIRKENFHDSPKTGQCEKKLRENRTFFTFEDLRKKIKHN